MIKEGTVEVRASEPDVKASVAANSSQSADSREKGPQGRYVKLDDRLGSGAYKDV